MVLVMVVRKQELSAKKSRVKGHVLCNQAPRSDKNVMGGQGIRPSSTYLLSDVLNIRCPDPIEGASRTTTIVPFYLPLCKERQVSVSSKLEHQKMGEDL
jgi:hypothetical protein